MKLLQTYLKDMHLTHVFYKYSSQFRKKTIYKRKETIYYDSNIPTLEPQNFNLFCYRIETFVKISNRLKQNCQF